MSTGFTLCSPTHSWPLGMSCPASTTDPASSAAFVSTYDPGASTHRAPTITLSSITAELMDVHAPIVVNCPMRVAALLCGWGGWG